jgi:hypothetical protein
VRRLNLLLLLLACLWPASAQADGWPFGGGRSPAATGRDLWNLGVLGAKARDADAAVPGPQTSGVHRASPGASGRVDGGPCRLRLELLFPGGPAEKAGLHPGDVIVGIGHRAFGDEGSRAALAKALEKAESRKGELTLLVERGGASGSHEKVDVTLPETDRELAKPTRGRGRTLILQAALAWLAKHQEEGGGFPETLSGLNGAVCQTALAGLAWLAGGSDRTHGPYAKNVERAAAFVMANAGKEGPMARMRAPGGANLNQTTWGVAHAAIFLGELWGRAHDSDVERALVALGASLAKRQEDSGGWGHGPGGPNPLGYVELNIVAGFALAGMGLARQAGFHVPEQVLERAESWLRASSSGDGGVGYSAKPGQAGMGNIARSAGCWLGYCDLGLGKSPWGRKMGHWAAHHAGDVLGGHASLMQQILLAGVAAHALGGRALKDFWAHCETDLVLARAPDGSLQPRPWHESLTMGSNSDVSFGQVWTTAAWAIVLGCEPEKGVRPGLPYWMGLERMDADRKR